MKKIKCVTTSDKSFRHSKEKVLYDSKQSHQIEKSHQFFLKLSKLNINYSIFYCSEVDTTVSRIQTKVISYRSLKSY